MNTRSNLAIVLLISASFAWPSHAGAERAWDGSIHFVDINMKFSFGGLEYGYWYDVGYLDFPGKNTRISREYDIGMMILPDQNDPLRSTMKGTIRLEVDGKKAELEKLVLVRSTRYGKWRIDPEIIKRLEDTEKARRDAASKAKASTTRTPRDGGEMPKDD
ncbi:hypothetical protein SH528x_003670 [Novipirellula sp. SH528]|uniref:hypothetical protein n=1 Tax=Novipirellula sp. SH528 TaxID=3454466 RepID=UPI003FA145FF